MARREWSPTVAECRFLSREDLSREWSIAVRRAAAAKFPMQTVELGKASRMAAYLVLAERLDEATAKRHLRAAARRSGITPAQAEKVIGDRYLDGRAYAVSEEYHERYEGGIRGHAPGAFSAVASGSSTYDFENQFQIDPSCLVPLPPAVLVHRGHHLFRPPIGIGLPRFDGGKVHLDAVFATSAGSAWTLLRKGRLRGVSIYAATNEFHRGVSGQLTRGTLVAVDVVRTPADETAAIGNATEARQLSVGQRRTQQLLDEYIANDANPLGSDLLRAASQMGVAALDVLAPIVAPLRAERGRRSLAECKA